MSDCFLAEAFLITSPDAAILSWQTEQQNISALLISDKQQTNEDSDMRRAADTFHLSSVSLWTGAADGDGP